MFAEAAMDPRSRYRPQGEEIDGSFVHHGRPMLLEAKWTAEPVAASTLYQFRGKVDGKLVGTVGLFISMGGYSKDAVDALVAGKTLNLILADGDDMRLIADGELGIQEAIDLKLRAAAEEGTPFVHLPRSRVALGPSPSAVIIVEGSHDAEIVINLVRAHNPSLAYTVTTAGGRLNLPLVALAQLSLQPTATELIIIADGDGRPRDIRHHIQRTLTEGVLPPDAAVSTFTVDPDLESALGLRRPDGHRMRGGELKHTIVKMDLRSLALGRSDLAGIFAKLGLLSDLDTRRP